MNLIATKLEGVLIIEPDVNRDDRGWFLESWSKDKFGIDIAFVQDNHSFSARKGTLRGLHFQKQPNAQSKLVRCTSGVILDVVVDIRNGSPTFCQWISMELSSSNFKQLFVPKGFAHGFLTLTDNVEVQYKVDEFYVSESECCICWNDPKIGIEWHISNPILSAKDRNAYLFNDVKNHFKMELL
jgi:dTDP-4-dehydrorhamnose 3,5-epimerase